MALISKDDSIRTGIRLFDDNNSMLIDAMNRIDEKIRFGASRDDIIRIIKEFETVYADISASESIFMEMHAYENIDYVKLLHVVQQRFISQQNLRIIDNKIDMTKECVFQFREIVMNVINSDKNCARFLQKRYKGMI